MHNDKLLVGLIGAGIQRSLTPSMHEEEARAQGLRLHYQLIDLDRSARGADELPTLIAAARTMGFAGLNITFPCKQSVMPLLDALDDEAQAMGAVNTVVLHDGRLSSRSGSAGLLNPPRGAGDVPVGLGAFVGHNTDGSGWRWGFERALPGADLSRVVLLGAGGAGSAIAHALLRMRCETLVLVDADAARADEAAQRLGQQYPAARVIAAPSAAEALQGASGLVHATPTGMDKLPGLPLAASLLRPSLWVSEIVYFPLDTALLQAARAAGCRVADGGGMAVGQAALAFELFTGRRADAERMQRHFRALIGARDARELTA